MAKTIEELDFKLVLDDKKFTQQIQDDLESARKLNKSLSDVLSMKRQLNGITQEDVANHRRALQERKDEVKYAEMETRERIKTAMEQERFNQLREKGNRHQSTSNRLLREATSLAASYVSLWGAKKLIENIVQTTGEFELQRTTLAAMLQDAEKATQIFEQLKTFSVSSPFSFKELATYAKQLTAYSVPVEDLYNTTKMLADVSAGLGVGMDRLVLAYGQVRSAEFLRGQEVRQFTESGIPILEELRKQFVAMGEEGITVADVFDKISKRLVPFEMVDKVFKDLTSEGGKFYQMQEIQSETLKGKISNLKDAYMIMFNEIGSRQSGLLKGGVDTLRSLAENYEKVGRVIVSLISIYGGYKATLALIRVWQSAEVLAMTKGVGAITKFGKAIKLATTESKAFAVIEKTISNINPWAAIGAAVAGIGAYFIKTGLQAARFRKELENISSVKFEEAENSVKTFKKLADQLKNSTVGSQAYRDAIASLNNQYGDYLPNLLSEKNALTEILKVENEVTNAIYARAKAYASEEGLQKIEDKYGEKVRESGNALVDILKDYWANPSDYGLGMIGEESASTFLKGFRSVLEKGSGDATELFKREMSNFFGWSPSNFDSGVLNRYARAVRGLYDETEKFQKSIDRQFGTQGYSTFIEGELLKPIESAFFNAKKKLDNMTLSTEEYDNALRNIKLDRLFQIKKAYEQLDAESSKPGSYLLKIKEIQKEIDALQPKDLGWLQKIVNPLVTGKGNNDLKAQIDTGYDEYLDNIRKEYSAVSKAYADSDKTFKKLTEDKRRGVAVDAEVIKKATEQNEIYKERKKVIESIGNALGISVDDKVTNKSKGKSQEQEDLETRIDLLKKLQSAYEKLADYLDDDKMKEVLSNLFSSTQITDKDKIIEALDFRKQLVDAALKLESYDEEAAERLRSYIGYDGVSDQVDEYIKLAKAQKEALKAQESLSDYLKSWNIGDETEGAGSIYKVTKIVSDYQRSLDGLNDKRDEAIEKLEEWIAAEKKAGRVVDESTEAEKRSEIAIKYKTSATNLLNKATEDVRNVAEDYVKEWADLNGIDLSNWSHKTIYELNTIQAALDNIDASNLPEEIIAALNKAGIDIEAFKEAVKSVAKTNSDKAQTLSDEKKWNNLLKSIEALASLFDKIGDFAESAGNRGLRAFANGMTSSFRTMGDIAERVAQQDYIGAIISGVDSVASSFLEAAANAAELERNIRNGKIAAESLRTELALGRNVEGIFGDNELTSISNAWEVAAEKFKTAASDIAKAKEKLTGGKDNDSNGWGALGGLAAGAAAGAGLGALLGGGIVSWLTAPIGALIGGVVGVVTGGLSDISHEMDNFSMSIVEMADKINAPLINEETGLLNVDTLQLILDTYDQLDKTSKDAIEAMIAHLEDYEKALGQLRDGMKDIFGEVADDIASKFIEAFKASGEAALDYADILDNVATSLAQMVLKSALIEKVFSDDLANDIADKVAKGKMDEALALFDSAMSEAQLLAPTFQEFLESISQYLQPGDGSGESLGDGIKGITEDTASLLASYINAIRADVSYGKTQRDSILSEVKNIASYVANPTLLDYINRIQANTYDNARATESLLADIRSMMTTDGGFTALRVYS